MGFGCTRARTVNLPTLPVAAAAAAAAAPVDAPRDGGSPPRGDVPSGSSLTFLASSVTK